MHVQEIVDSCPTVAWTPRGRELIHAVFACKQGEVRKIVERIVRYEHNSLHSLWWFAVARKLIKPKLTDSDGLGMVKIQITEMLNLGESSLREKHLEWERNFVL